MHRRLLLGSGCAGELRLPRKPYACKDRRRARRLRRRQRQKRATKPLHRLRTGGQIMPTLVSHPDEVKIISRRFGQGAANIDKYLELDGYKAVQQAIEQ